MAAELKDLLIVVPCKNTQFTLRGGLSRPEAIGIRAVSYEIVVHSNRDPGVRTTGAALANLRRAQFQHALLVFDHEGCGAEENTPDELQQQIEAELQPVWGESARVVVINPEVDVWLWGSDNALAGVLSWPSDKGGIREWLTAQGWQFGQKGKPVRPKEAFEKLREIHKQPRSSSLYETIAGKLSLKNCSDGAFQRIAEILRQWFSPPLG